MASGWSVVKKWFGESLDLPQDVVLNLPRITMIGQYQLYVENHRGVLRFTDEELRIQLNSGQLVIRGKGMMIRQISREDIFLEGDAIRSVTYFDESMTQKIM